ncbi:MAG: hypothetical protein AB7V46_03290 [Thermomicrobiales bacterium]
MIALVVRPFVALLVASAVDHAVAVEARSRDAGESTGAFRLEVALPSGRVASKGDQAWIRRGAQRVGQLALTVVITVTGPAKIGHVCRAVGMVVAATLAFLADQPARTSLTAAPAIQRIRIRG